ncbi:MAG: hypothetical protein CMO55_06740 [Verrucomicrobiales bacterium]|nr:hypothetical protein [Verrucomicrobiales bacterium]
MTSRLPALTIAAAFLLPLIGRSQPLVLENGGLKNTYRLIFDEISPDMGFLRGSLEILGDDTGREKPHTKLPFAGTITPIEGRDNAETLELRGTTLLSFSPPQNPEEPFPLINGTLYNRLTDTPGARIYFYSYDADAGEWDTFPFDFGTIPEGEELTGEVDWLSLVSVGGFSLGMPGVIANRIINGKFTTSEEILEGATGLFVQDWTAPGLGLTLKMGHEEDSKQQHIESIEISGQSQLKTDRGVGIGTPRSEVEKKYAAEIEEAEQFDDIENQIVAGSVFGGIIFTFDEDEKVTTIFVGAAAE